MRNVDLLENAKETARTYEWVLYKLFQAQFRIFHNDIHLDEHIIEKITKHHEVMQKLNQEILDYIKEQEALREKERLEQEGEDEEEED